ncbi:ABC transporter permease family protein [Streptomyces griseoluteus]|uniref:ABC transporter permease n=1 Tax=Streptomyces griseoluteus TaxID=29306 RepID=UPI00382FAFBE
MRSDLRLAWLLTNGSDRREWWRIGLTAVGAAGVAAFGAMASAVASVRGYTNLPVAHGLLNNPGQRSGVIVALLLLLIPGLGFLGQCARLGAVHRDRRMARLRLAGATPGRVRRIAALESGPACLVGSVLGTSAVVGCALYADRFPARLWWVLVVVMLAVPIVGVAVSLAALRRVVASPLGEVRATPRRTGGGRAVTLGVALLVVAVTGGILMLAYGSTRLVPLVLFGALLLVGAGAVSMSGGIARLTGRRGAARAQSPAVLIAAERLSADPWAAARTHAAVLMVTVVGTGFMGVREGMLRGLDHDRYSPTEALDLYTSGINLAGAAILVGLLIVLVSVAVGAAESVAHRRRGLAQQVAAGVPRTVLNRAVLLETALPLAPALLVAGVGGLAVGTWYASLTEHALTVPYVALAVPPLIFAACLLAAGTSLPLLRRSTRPAELRHR